MEGVRRKMYIPQLASPSVCVCVGGGGGGGGTPTVVEVQRKVCTYGRPLWLGQG